MLSKDTNPRYRYWSERISSLGASQAYAALSDEIAAISIGEQHVQAHAFGGALYATKGISGLSVCDSRFSFGCFHEFLGNAIADQGIGIVQTLNRECEKALADSSPLSCQHGIGHGIQSYYGYEYADLIKSLELCRDLKNDRIGGCYGGVFMEYNLRTMWGDAAQPRVATRETVGDICHSVEESFKPACVYWSSQWWLQVLYRGEGTVESFATLGDICREIAKNDSLMRDCIEGIGTVAPQSAEYNPEKTIELCSAVSKSTRDALFCRSTAANIFFVDVSKDAAEAVCKGYFGEEQRYCLAYAHNEANVFFELPSIL